MLVSSISKIETEESEIVNGYKTKEVVFNFIKKIHEFYPEKIISIEELNKYKRLYLANLIEQEK